jgi:RimJ/RimL family protein N-acetyltransferase
MPVVLLPYREDSHKAILDDWLGRTHVAKWWGLKRAEGVVEEAGVGQCRIIAEDDVPIGFIRWHVLERKELDEAGLLEIPEGGVDFDILIGEEPMTGRGYGPAAINAAVALLDATIQPPFYTLCTSVDNARAFSAYRKAVFSLARTFDDPENGPTYLLQRFP